MSFTPLPKIFTDFCSNLDLSHAQIMEFGCGDGRFLDVLSNLGVAGWGLDRVSPECGTVAHVVGEATIPPLAPASLDLLVVPNLLRHILPAIADFSFLGRWLELLKPAGALFIFEDEPGSASPGETNYRDLQIFLARLLPETRGPLISLEKFQAKGAPALGGAYWEFGLVRNRQTIASAPVVEMLDPDLEAGGDAGRLARNIARDGLDPGHYWWALAMSAVEGPAN